MKKMIVMRILLLAVLVILAACVNVKEEEGKLTVVKSEGVIRISLEEKAVGATVKIAEKCNVSFEFGNTILPNYDVPEEFATHYDYLEKLCNDFRGEIL